MIGKDKNMNHNESNNKMSRKSRRIMMIVRPLSVHCIDLRIPTCFSLCKKNVYPLIFFSFFFFFDLWFVGKLGNFTRWLLELFLRGKKGEDFLYFFFPHKRLQTNYHNTIKLTSFFYASAIFTLTSLTRLPH